MRVCLAYGAEFVHYCDLYRAEPPRAAALEAVVEAELP